MASVILGASVMAVISAMSTAQNLALEGQRRVLGAMAANDLMIELATLAYSELRSKQAMNEAPGELTTLDGSKYPGSYWSVGRTATFVEDTVTDAKSGAVIKGVKVTITAVDEASELCSVEAFFPEPQGGAS